MRSATSSEQGATSSTQSGRADATSIGRVVAADWASTSRTTATTWRRGDRLAHEAVGLIAEGAQQRVRGVVGGHHHDPGRHRDGPRLGQHLEAVHARQADVEQHQVDGPAAQLGQRIHAVAGLIGGVAGLLEQRGDGMAEGPIVVHDQHVADLGLGSHAAPPGMERSADVTNRSEWR